MLHKTEIAQREPLRQELEAHVNEYLSRGGQISVIPPGESTLPDEFALGMRNRQDQRGAEYEMRARVARFYGGGYA